MNVPVFTCRTEETRGSADSVLSQVFDCDNLYVALDGAPGCAQRMMSLLGGAQQAHGDRLRRARYG